MGLSVLATIFEITVLFVICFAVLVGNVRLFIIVKKDRNLRTITNVHSKPRCSRDVGFSSKHASYFGDDYHDCSLLSRNSLGNGLFLLQHFEDYKKIEKKNPPQLHEIRRHFISKRA